MDFHHLKEIYESERLKRLRLDGPMQYVDLHDEQFAHLNKDCWINYDDIANKEPDLKDKDEIKFLVIGGGHAGLSFAYRVFETGVLGRDICVVDVAGGVGGTWYWNRYPGLMCDVEGYIYLPLLEETGYMPKHRYSYGTEIRQQSERIASHIGCRSMFSTTVKRMDWDEGSARWIVIMSQNRGPEQGITNFTVKAQFVFASKGPFIVPRLPRAPGFDAFERNNHVFHTSRWDYKCTGGSPEVQDLTLLRDKTVAVVGTGATGVQVIPEVAKWAKHLYVVQRTPSFVGPRNQKETDLNEWAQITSHPGWQHRRRKNFNHFITNDPLPVDLVNDGWTETRAFAGVIGGPKIVTQDTLPQHLESMFELDIPRAEIIRAFIDSQVENDKIAEKLKPWYSGWCKRPTFHDHYLATFNRPNVTLLDTNGKGLEEYTSSGIVVGGVEYKVDILILATGFSSSRSKDRGLEDALGGPVVGRNGRSLGEKWASPQVGGLYGIMTEGFPNLFFPGGAASPNLSSSYDITARFSAYLIKQAMEKMSNCSTILIEPTLGGEEHYTKEVVKRALYFAVLKTCTPGYFTHDGAIALPKSAEETARDLRKAPWGEGIVKYQHMVESLQVEGRTDGFNISSA
ncbi:putative monooxygenase [Aspergillus flavus]|uniref:Monooxygenase n=1 Tax=Aspergillus flavus (strain ATCC 200026 / FGSC A1120 / IAM 13836 / NRRL 3357 / JCM 12722 / SRRC 167) TaxID=332952 RepID=A0A7G5KJE1_ASPFN|nr:uncharacterized protein G4B84_011450 [Aspergillus flavus NRRL3357]KAF7629555.1 hypothetical protein AFLA_013269 [Aspergillus flavus NRRL3357]QMW35921.1 hypothetical protein G4B84_011450 [Aspergillus flavus NRRL3357]QMW47983.1 hypothetical protein G4B11_011501 [Aspergillus flavus]QRD93138.1 putative monooxygenase [Aspergillus flavus]